MSSKLKPLDLTSAIVGTTGVIDFNQFSKFNPLHMQDKAHIWLYNESGAGTDILMQASGNSHYLPAGAWGTFDLEPNDSQITVTVTYLLPNAPVSLLNAIYYAPGEPVPQAFTLGNSPMGITGGVSTSSVQTLSQEGAAAPLLTIDIGDTNFPQLITIYNDGHAVWSIDIGGVKHQVLSFSTTGNPVQLGKAGDTSEVLGALTVDQATVLTGIVTAAAANVFGAIGVLTHILGTLTVDQAALITGILTLTAQPQLTAKKIGDGSGNNLVDWSAAGIFLKGNPANVAGFHYQGDGANTDFQLSAISKFTGTGNGTFAHGLKQAGVATTPDIIIAVQNVLGSQTFGYSSLGSVNVTIATGAGNSWVALAIKL